MDFNYVTDEERLEEDIRACLSMEPAHVFAVIFRDQCRMFYISLLEWKYLNITENQETIISW